MSGFRACLGRKTTLVAALLTMGISTVIIGLLPTYHQIGVVAPLLLALCRFGQGFGLGGEWGGAVLLATENAPPGKHNWYAMFPQLGAPVGLFLSSGVFWILLHCISPEALLSWGWRMPKAFRGERLAIRPKDRDGHYGVFFGSRQVGEIDLTDSKSVSDVSEQASAMSPG
ncbi:MULTISPECIES: MFS transporter [unclassified Tardiphaga]|uniref:MFS transporter n=1 Tax=Tardiphaga sp. TaxID=1926292 RepID=UPI00210FD601|nr:MULTISPECIES: MFS transporter [unclassified Tardiphaga]